VLGSEHKCLFVDRYKKKNDWFISIQLPLALQYCCFIRAFTFTGLILLNPDKNMKNTLLVLVLASSICTVKAQTVTADTSIFSDAAHHWYDIRDNSAIIMPRPGHPRYRATEISNIADNILLYQKDNGGWPKNYDMQAILLPRQKDSLVMAKSTLNTTFDNRTTYSHIAYLCSAYKSTGSEQYKNAALKGLDFILASQYTNGGWPQYFPLEKEYSRYITFNDDVFSGILWLLKDIADGKQAYAFLDKTYKSRLQDAFVKGLDCVLRTQINDMGKPTAWCQQYNEVTLEPAWARKFEPPSICNGESVNIVLLLMSINNPSDRIIAAVQNAIAWFKASAIIATKVVTISAPEMITPYRISKTDKIVVTDSGAAPIWTRYYELKTHRPLFCNRDSKLVYSLAGVLRERRDGYGWYTYEPQKAINRFPEWEKKWVKHIP
jgi:PelA/Pel-15E family pectate lyase